MTILLPTPSQSLPPAQPLRPSLWRRARYLLVCLLVNVVIWSFSLVYLKVAPVVYTCGWSLILPGTGSGVSVNLSEGGSISSSTASPFAGGSSVDPRANYKSIAESSTVISAAAKIAKVTKFGKPKVKLVDQTSIIEFVIEGKTPEQAQQKSLALFAAMEHRINELREDELIRRQQGFKSVIGEARTKLEAAQQEILRYKSSADIASTSQAQDIVGTIEQMRKELAETRAQQARMAARLHSLGSSLNLTPQQAADAFALHADALLQQHLKDWGDSTAALVLYRSKWGDNHPQVLKELAKQRVAASAMLNRSQLLLGHPIHVETLAHMELRPEGSNRANLFSDLVSTHSEVDASAGQAKELDHQINLFESRQRGLTKRVAHLEALQRNMQVAEAVFTSTLGKLDVGKSDIFASYPLIQILIEPDLPESPSAPKKAFVFLGAGVGSLLATAGLTIGWLRNKRKQEKLA
ncbi:MAG: hypothetical protein H7Y37_08715 [Anaerolineae bacterium]|nr:hypothetical protein [Gloeobacterales cyanobacterium ES-bin-313]